MTLPAPFTVTPVSASAGPLRTDGASWVVGWSSGQGSATPFQVTIASSLKASPAPVAAQALVTQYWSDGPPEVPLADFGITGFGPPTGVGTTLLAAIDAALVAAAAVYGPGMLNDGAGELRATLTACWLLWEQNGGLVVAGGMGGALQTVTLQLG